MVSFLAILLIGVLWIRSEAGGFEVLPFAVFTVGAFIAFVAVSIMGNMLLKVAMTSRHPIDAALWETISSSSSSALAASALSEEAKNDRVLGALSLGLSFARVAVPVVAGGFLASLAV